MFGGSRRKHKHNSSLHLLGAQQQMREGQDPNGPGSGIKGNDSVQHAAGLVQPGAGLMQPGAGLKQAGGQSDAPGEALKGNTDQKPPRKVRRQTPVVLSPYAN